MKKFLKKLSLPLLTGLLVGVIIAGSVMATGTIVVKTNGGGANSEIKLVEGLWLTESETPDMNVNYTSGAIRNGNTYYYTATGDALAVSAASASTERLDIVQKPTNSNGAPEIKQGDEQGTGTTNMATASSTPVTRYIFYNSSPDYYRYQAWQYVNGSGTDYLLKTLLTNSANNGGTITLSLYATPDNGSDSPDWDNKVLIETKSGISSSPNTQTWSDIDTTFDNSDKVWLVLVGSNASNPNQHWGISCAQSANTTMGTGITSLHKLSNDNGVTWNTSLGTNGSWKQLDAGSADPSYPTADANYEAIGYIGSDATPIADDTDALTTDSPTGTEAQIIPINDKRL